MLFAKCDRNRDCKIVQSENVGPGRSLVTFFVVKQLCFLSLLVQGSTANNFKGAVM